MHRVPVTPMIGPEKERILKALNLYFETPEHERIKYQKPIELPPEIEGRQEYIDKIHKMSLDELKKEMRQYGFKCGSKKMMLQRLEMAWDALHPNSPMNRALNQHIQNQHDHPNHNHNQKKNQKPTKKTRIEIEEDIIKFIQSNDDLLLRIATLTAIKFEEIESFCKSNHIKISKKNLQTFLDEQGICFILPQNENAVHGPRRCGRRRKRGK